MTMLCHWAQKKIFRNHFYCHLDRLKNRPKCNCLYVTLLAEASTFFIRTVYFPLQKAGLWLRMKNCINCVLPVILGKKTYVYEINRVSVRVSVDCQITWWITGKSNPCVLAITVLPLNLMFHQTEWLTAKLNWPDTNVSYGTCLK